jgi:ATP-dependent 26S proteasome regulatory subunit
MKRRPPKGSVPPVPFDSEKKIQFTEWELNRNEYFKKAMAIAEDMVDKTEDTEDMINESMTKKLDDNDEEVVTHLWEVMAKDTFKPTGDAVTTKSIPSGFYSLHNNSQDGIHIKKKSFINDKYIDLPNPAFKEIKKDIERFWGLKDRFDEYGLVHKRGILLYGTQGTGKSFLIAALIEHVINQREGCVFSISSSEDLIIFSAFFTTYFRKIEPTRPVIVTIEDIDGLFHDKSNETRLLNILDGMKHTSNIVYLATTNHIEQLEERFANRPSRFDRRYRIDNPDEASRRLFISETLKKKDLKKIDLDDWVAKTDGFSTAHLKELITCVIMFESDLEYGLEYINDMRKRPKSDIPWNSGSNPAGFRKQ